MNRIPLIIDCDPGTDDAMCIMVLGASSKYEIKGITAVHGNVPLQHTAENALFLSHYYGIDCPVYRGAQQALIVRNERAAYVHGGNGLADYEYSTEGLSYAEGYAWDFLYRSAKEYAGELEILACGPLTNLAVTIIKYPDFASFVKRLVIMGGAAHSGNTSPLAEFNFQQDPHAVQVVLQAGFKDVTIVDLDCCNTAWLNPEEQKTMAALPVNNRIHGLLAQIMEHKVISDANIIRVHGERAGRDRAARMVVCDAVAAAIAVDPSLAQYWDVFMVCETEGGQTAGQSVIDRLGLSGRTNVHLAMNMDRDRYAALFMNSLKHYEEA